MMPTLENLEKALLKLELITTTEQFEALQTEWNTLLASNATDEVFLTWEWQSTWWHAYQPGDLWVIAGWDAAGRLVGIAPWFVEQPTRTIRTIGCVDVTDYLDVLAAPAYRETFLSGVAACLAGHAGAYAAIDLCNIPEGSPTLESLPRLLAERGFAVRVKLQEVCPTIALPGDFEAYLGQLDKKQRHEARRKLRRAEEAAEDKVGWYIVGPQHDLAAEMERFIQLMAASHPEKDAFLQDPKNMAFFRALVPQMAACGWLQLSFLTVNGNPAAAYLNLDYHNRILVYNSGLVPATYSYLSPGIVLLLYNIRHAIETGRSHFDFLRGSEEYKYRMGAQDFRVMNLEATRDGLDSLPSPERDEKK